MSGRLTIRPWYNWCERRLQERVAELERDLAAAREDAEASARDAERFLAARDGLVREMYHAAEERGA